MKLANHAIQHSGGGSRAFVVHSRQRSTVKSLTCAKTDKSVAYIAVRQKSTLLWAIN
jgi:hypothetical protein